MASALALRYLLSVPEPQNIIIFAPTWVGDLVMATGPIAAVRAAYPDAKLTLLAKPGRDKIVSGSADIDEVIVDRSGGSLRGIWRLAGELRARRFDLGLLFPNSIRVAALAFLARIPRRIGYRRDGRGLLLTDAIEYERENGKRKPVPMPLFYERILARAGIELPDTRPRLVVTESCEAQAREFAERVGISPGERLVGLNPGASYGASKLWPPAHFAALADKLHRRWRRRTIVLVGPGEEPIAAEIEQAMETPVISTASDILPLDVLKPIVRDLDLLVSTDTGTRQYAVAFDVPVAVVMGPTDPRYSGIHLEKSTVVRHDVDCGPCHLKVCPIDHKCMVGITADEVFARIEELDERVGVFDKADS